MPWSPPVEGGDEVRRRRGSARRRARPAARAATSAIGSSTRTTVRTRSAQKLPTRPASPRSRPLASPRASAAATAMPTAGGQEVLHRQAAGLHEVAERGLAGVPLPVGVGHEADGGVPRAVGRQGAEAERERQVLLQPAEGVEHEDADQREAEHREGVGAPVLVGVGVDAQHPVGRPLDARGAARRCRGGPASRPRNGTVRARRATSSGDLPERGSRARSRVTAGSRRPTSSASSANATTVVSR